MIRMRPRIRRITITAGALFAFVVLPLSSQAIASNPVIEGNGTVHIKTLTVPFSSLESDAAKKIVA